MIMDIGKIADKNDGLLVFNDSIGRTCYGKLEQENADYVVIDQPAIIMVVPSENGQARVDILRLFFQEFIERSEDGTQPCMVHFNKKDITVFDTKITEALKSHFFEKILETSKVVEPSNAPEQIQLFDS